MVSAVCGAVCVALWSVMLLTGCSDAGLSFRSNQEIQTYAIALINALFLKAPEDRRQVSERLSQHRVRVTDIKHVTAKLVFFIPVKHLKRLTLHSHSLTFVQLISSPHVCHVEDSV